MGWGRWAVASQAPAEQAFPWRPWASARGAVGVRAEGRRRWRGDALSGRGQEPSRRSRSAGRTRRFSRREDALHRPLRASIERAERLPFRQSGCDSGYTPDLAVAKRIGRGARAVSGRSDQDGHQRPSQQCLQRSARQGRFLPRDPRPQLHRPSRRVRPGHGGRSLSVHVRSSSFHPGLTRHTKRCRRKTPVVSAQ